MRHDVKRSFSLAAATYDVNSSFQRLVSGKLASFIERGLSGGEVTASPGAVRSCATGFGIERQVKGDGSLLDIGTGTGALLKSLNGLYPRKFGCDISLPMLLKAKDAEGITGLAAADLEALPFGDSSFSVAASNLTYQWAKDAPKAFREVSRVLAPGGMFFFTTLGPLTLHEARECYEEAFVNKRRERKGAVRFMGFMDMEALKEALASSGLEPLAIEKRLTEREYPSLLTLLKTLKGIGAMKRAVDGIEGLGKAAILKEAERIYRERFPSPAGIRATYEVMYVHARKP